MEGLKKSILLLKGENKLNDFLMMLETQKKEVSSLPPAFSNVNFVFSDGGEEMSVLEFDLVVLLTNPDQRLWNIMLEAEKQGIPTLNQSNLILKYNDCLETQLDLHKWGFPIPRLGKAGIKKRRFHESRKNGKKSFLHWNSNIDQDTESWYFEEMIDGDLFKIKVLGRQTPYVVQIKKNEAGTETRIDRTKDFTWLAEIGLEIALKVGSDLLSIDIIIESSSGIPFCIDINLGNALTGVNNGAIELLTYLSKRVTEGGEYPRVPSVPSLS